MAGDMVRLRSGTTAEIPLPEKSVAGIGGQPPWTRERRIFPNRSVRACGKADGKR